MKFSNSTAWTFSKSNKDVKMKPSSPGPWKYDPKEETLRSKSPLWSMGSEKRLKENQYETPNPGPGSHTVESKYEGKTTFGQRINTSVNHYPGPGEYSPNYTGTYKAPISYTMGNKNDKQSRAKTPGPGTYNTTRDDAFMKSNGKFSKNKRENPMLTSCESMRELPGPGAYNSTENFLKTKKSAPSFSFGERLKTCETKVNLGPGQYETKELDRGVCYTFKSRIPEKVNNNPGPGKYNASEEFIKVSRASPSYKLGTSKRITAPDPTSEGVVPGPGKYEHETTKTYKSVNWKYQGEREILKKSKNDKLGPGDYNYKPTFGEAPKFTLAGRRKSMEGLKVPGPGAYNVADNQKNIAEKNPVWKMPTSMRKSEDNFVDKKKVCPAPGSYNETDIEKYGKLGIKFSTLERYKEQKPSAIGPGSYNIPSSIGWKKN